MMTKEELDAFQTMANVIESTSKHLNETTRLLAKLTDHVYYLDTKVRNLERENDTRETRTQVRADEAGN